jgi:hypothetical protein
MGNISSNLRKNAKYINKLSNSKKDIIYKYTANNSTIEKNLDDKNTLIDIINNAPVLTSPMVVYRGVRLKFMSNLKTSLTTFVSTSLSKDIGRSFIKTGGVILAITLQPGTKYLYVKNVSKYKTEEEIVLPPQGVFILTHEGFEKIYDDIYGKMFTIKVLYVTYLPAESKPLGEINEE